MSELASPMFDPNAFLAGSGPGRGHLQLRTKQRFFSQGQPSDCVFYLKSGRVRLTVVSATGKEATIGLLTSGDFLGEESIAGGPGVRMATATAITACSALRIECDEMLRVIHEEQRFADLFLKFLIARGVRTQADLIDHLFNNSEKRLARILLLMAEFGVPGKLGAPEFLIPPITQEMLAEMVGTTRSRVSFFMNRFRKLGFIQYNGRICVNETLLTVISHDRPAGRKAKSAQLDGVTTKGRQKRRANSQSKSRPSDEE